MVENCNDYTVSEDVLKAPLVRADRHVVLISFSNPKWNHVTMQASFHGELCTADNPYYLLDGLAQQISWWKRFLSCGWERT